MVERVRPQRLGNNQNYAYRNKKRSPHDSAPISYPNQPQDKGADT